VKPYIVEKGRASLMLKGSSKRKRNRDELEEVKQEEDALKEDRHLFLKEFKRLKDEHVEMLEALKGFQIQQQMQMEAAQLQGDDLPGQIFNI
jgi:predicted nuclease with TOPRIM domain